MDEEKRFFLVVVFWKVTWLYLSYYEKINKIFGIEGAFDSRQVCDACSVRYGKRMVFW